MASYQSLLIEMALQKLSESVYVVLCLKDEIGTSQQVAIRRELDDFREIIENKRTDFNTMKSGSMREGFRFVDSDLDKMFWQDNNKVLWDFSQSVFYNTHRCTLILCDSSESPPGFTLLWLPLETTNAFLLSSCVRISGTRYISSAQYRNNRCTLANRLKNLNSAVHGPCTSGRHGTMEYDLAFCFFSEFWPPSAYSWKNRSQSWPPPNVVDKIVKNGCHFVAIGHKLGKHADNEWRISFSQAEQKLVYAMNHTQFVTYGLLKLFVKEINNGLGEEEKLLCSYHMKTAIFWALQQNTTHHWCPQNLLGGFWICFKLLLKWVYEGVCPNFFIPENNMFLNKVHGAAQANLFLRLYALYEKGIAFLLHSPSISPFIIKVLCNPRLTVCTDEQALISEAHLDRELFMEAQYCDTIDFPNIHECLAIMHIVKQLLRSPLRQSHIIQLQIRTANALQSCAFMLHHIYTEAYSVNKCMYIADKISCYMLKLAAKFSSVSDLLFIAMYFYKTLRYKEALSVIDMTKVKFLQPGMMHDTNVNPGRYSEAVGGLSCSFKMRRVVAQNIKLYGRVHYINELIPELQSMLQQNIPTMYIPPFVIVYMLRFLCFTHTDQLRAQEALLCLEFLLHNDQGVLVPVELRDISWEILGICQQISGNLQAARDSYEQSLRQFQFNFIQTATRYRLQDLH